MRSDMHYSCTYRPVCLIFVWWQIKVEKNIFVVETGDIVKLGWSATPESDREIDVKI